ncbi:hypothetical protein Tco_0455462 [Tanacetum coccineum]
MNKVGYQGVVDKVSAFYMKNLAQPWQTMFKVFNLYLTTRTSRHDQTKIKGVQLFHDVIKRTNFDYAALLWWDFMNNVFQKKEAIQYPRFIKLMIVYLMKKFPNIPQRIDECTLPTQGMRYIISTVSISPEGFLPSILLLVVIIVTVVIVVVTVILVVVVVAIVGHRALLPDPLTSGLW